MATQRSNWRLRLATRPINERRLAGLYGVAVVLHAVIDPAITYYLSIVPADSYEANPFLRWALREGPLAFIGIHLVFVVLAGSFFYLLLFFIRRAPPPKDRRLARLFRIGCFGLIAWGMGLALWNLSLLVR